ncbi:MAG: FKBP-type peptidyl-prolyl cis-trans isomerase [Bacteroidetes bacterium]|nr:FKBP-type peptidyl-prolyl cis-trans isomerase [Bacteroidota bacterium]
MAKFMNGIINNKEQTKLYSSKMKKLLSALFFITISIYGQEVKKFSYPNGQIKSEVAYDKDHVITKYSQWDQYGNLLSIEDFSKLYKEYPKKDFSKINWKSVTDGVFIYQFNKKDTNVVVNDSSFVVLNYQCYFANGQMLDNSFARGCPMQTQLNYMMKGFIIGIKQMKPGETALIKIDPKMAYGDSPSGNVPANSTLIYLVELLSVN